ncbi:hypothetical protein PAXINDRAFT_10816 [Paxillus involutus ATCC 200175]|nr:hypothetical protein PAXINDRAFT_10816 [Paxillus involutus ATCC 200175]
MSNFESARYYIVPAFPQQPDGPGVGVDLAVGGIERNVVFDGKFQVWNLVQVGPGKYDIVAETGWFSQASEGDNRGNVVVRETSPSKAWSITRLQDGNYVIAVDSPLFPNLVWTLVSQEPKAKVILQISEIALPNQQWLIKPVLDD